MIISRIIQNGLDLSIETNDIPYQCSANHKIQFVKDSNYSNYSLQAYGKLPKTGYQESEEFKLELEDGNYIKLPSAVFATKGIFQIAISLTGTSGDIINLGIVSYKIRKSFGDSTNILPDNEKAWNSFVHLEVDNYFKTTYQSKLNDVNTKLNEVKQKTEETKQLKNEVVSLKNDVTNLKNEANQAATKAETNANKTQESLNKFNQDMANTTADMDKRIDKLNATATTMEERVNKALDSIPNDYSDLQKQVNEVEDRESKDANGITQELTITDGYAQLTDTATKRLDSLVIKGNTVQNSTKGLNLINCTPKTTTINGITMVNNGDGTCTVNGTATDDFDIALAPYTTKQNIYYTLSGCPSGGSKTTYYLDPRGYEYDTGRGTTIINPHQDFSNYIRIVIKKDVTVNNLLFKPMFNEGQTAQPFEPYTGGKPSPSPEYPQEIKAVNKLSGVMCGKNLLKPHGSYPRTGYGITFNLMNDGIHVNGKCTASSWYTFIYSDTLQAGTYYINGIKGASNSRYQVVLYKNDVIIGYITTNNFKLVLKEKAKIKLSLYVYPGYGTFNDLVLPYMICRNENDLYLYTPYQGQSLLNYTLQNPLYKLSDVYDYIDFNRGKIVRNIGVITFDGSDDEDIRLSPPDGSRRVYLYLFRNSILSIENINPYCKSNMFKFTNLWTDGVMSHNHLFYVSSTNIYVSYNEITSLNDFKTWLNKNPITVYYQLATPTEEDIPQELLTQLKQLQTYSGETNISFEASDVYPTIDLEYIKDTKKYIESKTDLNAFVENMFAFQRTGDIYTVKFPKWETSHVSTGEKLDANAGLVCEPSTKTIKGQNDYENIPLFKTYDVNAYVDEHGVRHITAIKGQDNFKDTGKNDVFVLGMSYYEKVWSDDQYWYYSRTDSPRDGYTIARECINRDGSIQPFALYAKYVAGNIDGNLYSSKGLKPARYYGTTPLPVNTTNTDTSYNGLVSQCHKRGSFYSSGMTCDYKYILTTFYLKYGTLNTQSIMGGCNNYNAQYEASIKSSTNNTYFPLTKAQADYFPVGASVSIGYKYGGSSLDRYYSTVSIYADNVKIIKKVALDDSNTALYLDTNTPFNTANTSSGAVFCSAMHWRSGFSDDILGRDGCPCETKSELTNGKFPIVIQGIECMVGGYETYANAFMDIVDATGKREVYIQNDASLLTTNMTTAKSTYKKSPYSIQPQKLNSWNYITRIDFDLENGAFVQTNVGQDGSSTTTGFADGVYVDNASSGQREFLGFGTLGAGSSAGLSCLDAYYGVGPAHWGILARLSINGVGGELTA